MRFSLILPALILLGCGWIGWCRQAAISVVLASRERLVAEDREQSPGTRDPSGKTQQSRNIRSGRESSAAKQEEARAFSTRLISFLLRSEQQMSSGESSEDPAANRAVEDESLEMVDELLLLDAEQLKILVAELRADPRVSEKLRYGILGTALGSLAESDPPGTLALFAASPELVKGSNEGESAVAFALARVAEKSPQQAMEWIRTNAAEHPGMISLGMRTAVVEGAAKGDPRQAFALIDELGLTTGNAAGVSIASAAGTPAARTAVLEALREHLAGVTDDQARKDLMAATLSGMAEAALQDGYDRSAPWLESAQLSREEAKDYIISIAADDVGGDGGKWIAWMAAALPPEDYADRAGDIMSQWATRDYRAAESWLKEQPEGPARDIAAQSYAVALAPYEPGTATKWAQSLPAGEQRTELLVKVCKIWRKKDPAAAEAFAKQRGLELRAFMGEE